MNGRLRLVLCGTCLAIGAFHAPWATHVLAEDLTGTYAAVVDAGGKLPDDGSFAAAEMPEGPLDLDVPRTHPLRARATSHRR